MDGKTVSILDCSAEIRNMIWKLVLGDRKVTIGGWSQWITGVESRSKSGKVSVC